MKKELPIIHPPIETYQGSAFVLGVLMAYENTRNVCYNHYNNLVCNDTEDIFDLGLEFEGISAEDYRLRGVVEMNLYHLRNCVREKFFDFIKERIDQGNYIIFYSVDEYYLSYSANYCNRHYLHDTYIYGYDENCFLVMAYKNKKLHKIVVPAKEIEEASFSQIDQDSELSFCTLRPSLAVNIEIDKNKIKQEYHNYLYGLSTENQSPNRVYGVNIYDVLERCIKKMLDIRDISQAEIDLRPFRCLWEHKKLMKDRLPKIEESFAIQDEKHEHIYELERIAHIVFMLMIKYSMIHDKNLLKKVLMYMEKMKELERLILN